MLVVNIHAARRLEEGRVERAKPVTNIFEPDIHVVRECRRKHRVLHVMNRAAFDRCGNQVRPQQRHMAFAVVYRDHVAVHAFLEHEGLPAGTNMLFHERMCGVHGDVAKRFGIRIVRHLQAMWVVGIENGCVGRNLDRHAFDLGQLFERIDSLEPEVIGGDIEARICCFTSGCAGFMVT